MQHAVVAIRQTNSALHLAVRFITHAVHESVYLVDFQCCVEITSSVKVLERSYPFLPFGKFAEVKRLWWLNAKCRTWPGNEASPSPWSCFLLPPLSAMSTCTLSTILTHGKSDTLSLQKYPLLLTTIGPHRQHYPESSGPPYITNIPITPQRTARWLGVGKVWEWQSNKDMCSKPLLLGLM